MNPKVVAEMLGHSNVTITLNLYSHVSPTMQAEAVALMNKALATVRQFPTKGAILYVGPLRCDWSSCQLMAPTYDGSCL